MQYNAPLAMSTFKPELPTDGERVIIDTDPGVDDAMALILCASSGIRIEGVTIVQGNGKDVEQLGINANICLRLAGAKRNVEVYLGDGKAVGETKVTGASHSGVDVHGLDGLGEVRPPTVPSDMKFGELSAKDFIYKRCSELPGQVTLVTIGPLTNVAACLREHPDLVRLVKRVVLMGGAVLNKRGNRTPSSEANFADDPTAAHEVLTAGFADLVMAPLDVCYQLDLLALRTQLDESSNELAAFCSDISRFYAASYFKLGRSEVPLHDPVCIAYLMKPALFKWRDVRVDVETSGRITSGMSVADWRGQTGRPPNARVLIEVDSKAFCHLFVRTLADHDRGNAASNGNKRARLCLTPTPLPAPPAGRPSTPKLTALRALSLPPPPPHPRVGVGILLLQQGRPGFVLVGRRKGSHGSGMCQLPGGHLEMCETWEQCALRELEEETAIRIPRAYFAAVTNDDMTDVNAGKHYVTIVMIGCCSSEQEPKLMEPDKCEGWTWEQWDQLPEKLFHPLKKLSESSFKLPHPDALAAGSYAAAALSANCAHV